MTDRLIDLYAVSLPLDDLARPEDWQVVRRAWCLVFGEEPGDEWQNEVTRLRELHARTPLRPLDTWTAQDPDAILAAAVAVALADGEMSIEQNMLLDELRERLDLPFDALDDLLDAHFLAQLPATSPRERSVEPARKPLAPAPELWATLEQTVRREMLEMTRFYRARGFFREQAAWRDEELASALHAHSERYFTPLQRCDWEYLDADPSRVWEVDFTGNGEGPDFDLVPALGQLARISAGVFTPRAVELQEDNGQCTLSFELEGRRVVLRDLLEVDIQFDLMLVQRLNEALSRPVFCVGLFGDSHYFVAVEPEEVGDLRQRPLALYTAEDWLQYRQFVLERTSPPGT